MRKYDSKIRAKQAELTKSLITQSIQELIETKELRAISIKEICDLAQISVGTFYLYFENKEQALLYNYRASDSIFEAITFGEDAGPIDNLKQVLHQYIDMIEFDKIGNTRQLYIAHLMYYDEYFFSWDRGLISKILNTVQTCQTEGLFINKYTDKEITIKILKFVRGLLYDLCIRTQLIATDCWKEECCQDIDEYIKVFMV